MTDRNSVLEPCPFCGAQPYEADPTNFPGDWEHPWEHKGCFLDGYHITARTAWNRRALKQEGVEAVLPSEGGEFSRRQTAAPFAGRQSLPAALQDWLADVEEYLQDRHDIRDGEPGGPHPLPNDAMSLSSALKCALGEQP